MDILTLIALLTFTNVAMGTDIRDLPALSIERPAVIEQTCKRPQLACYTLNVVHVIDNVALDTDVYRSVIVHEVAHHIQEKLRRFGGTDTPERYALREQEAHKIQYQFLNQ